MIRERGVRLEPIPAAGTHRVVRIHREFVVHIEHHDILVGTKNDLLDLAARQINRRFFGRGRCGKMKRKTINERNHTHQSKIPHPSYLTSSSLAGNRVAH